MGIVFETPLLVFFMAKLGVVNARQLRAAQGAVATAIVAAVVTPTPDPVTYDDRDGPALSALRVWHHPGALCPAQAQNRGAEYRRRVLIAACSNKTSPCQRQGLVRVGLLQMGQHLLGMALGLDVGKDLQQPAVLAHHKRRPVDAFIGAPAPDLFAPGAIVATAWSGR